MPNANAQPHSLTIIPPPPTSPASILSNPNSILLCTLLFTLAALADELRTHPLKLLRMTLQLRHLTRAFAAAGSAPAPTAWRSWSRPWRRRVVVRRRLGCSGRRQSVSVALAGCWAGGQTLLQFRLFTLHHRQRRLHSLHGVAEIANLISSHLKLWKEKMCGW